MTDNRSLPANGRRSCPVCRGARAHLFARVPDRLFGVADGLFTLFRCEHCRSIFQEPLPAEGRLSAFYPRGYWWTAGAEGSPRKSLLTRLERAYRRLVIRDHVRFLVECAAENPPDRRSVLDIGCGSGMFLAGALRRGFDAHGMDASGAAVDAVRREYSIDVREGSIGSPVWGDERFDFVTLFHVLEHVVEPRQALRYAGSLLRPGGCLIIQVPNVDSAQARIFGKRWYGLDVPRHVIDFSARGLAALLEETGWVVTRGKRFSLRDNPASIASSLVPALDPIGRSGRGLRRGWRGAVAEVFYLGLFTVSVPLAWLEAMAGLGGTLWVAARARQPRISR